MSESRWGDLECVAIRPLRVADAGVLSNAFAAMGWSKPASLFDGYLDEQERELRWVRVAEVDGDLAGYVTVLWSASDTVLRKAGIPEIMDLNVLAPFRRRGIGSALLDAAECEAATRSPRIGLRVGLHAGYGAAQRLYVRRGYVPDGAGAVVGGASVPEGTTIRLDDEFTLRMIRSL